MAQRRINIRRAGLDETLSNLDIQVTVHNWTDRNLSMSEVSEKKSCKIVYMKLFKKLNRCRSPSISQQTNALRTKLFQLQDESIKQHLGPDFIKFSQSDVENQHCGCLNIIVGHRSVNNDARKYEPLKSYHLQMLYCSKIKSKWFTSSI